MNDAPQIVVIREAMDFRLFLQAPGCDPERAGPRLKRQEPLPITKFAFSTREEATEAAKKLSAYCKREHAAKPKKE